MTIIYLAEYNTRCYGVVIQNNGWVKVQKLEEISGDENSVYCVKPLETCLGKSEVCDMTIFSGALDKFVYDRNIILLKISEENNKYGYIYIGGNMVCSFLTNDEICNYISNMGNDLTPHSVAIGMENIYFLTPYFKFINKEKINDDDLLKSHDYHTSQCGKKLFEKLKTIKIHSNSD